MQAIVWVLIVINLLYLGLLPQLIGVAPEKAIKLTVSITTFKIEMSQHLPLFSCERFALVKHASLSWAICLI